MAGVTDERQAFVDAIFKPPYLARLIDTYGEFTARLDEADRAYFITRAVDILWERRDQIKSANSIYMRWEEALQETAASRSRWQVAISHYGVAVGSEWVSPRKLRRRKA